MAGVWGFVGCGNLAQAIIGGAVRRGALVPFNVVATDRELSKIQKFSKEVNIAVARDVAEVAQKADILVIATKPQDILPVLENLKHNASKDKAVVSLAAGVSSVLLLKHLGGFGSVIRVMANTPALVQQGLFGIFVAKKSADHVIEIERVFRTLGAVVNLKNDEQVNVITSGSASGVGFVLSFMEEFEAWLKKKGFKSQEARAISVETFLGTALLAKDRTSDPLSSLREAVTSKKGTTLAGLEAMKKAKVGTGLRAGLEAGHRRAVEIAKDLLRSKK